MDKIERLVNLYVKMTGEKRPEISTPDMNFKLGQNKSVKK